MSPPPTTFFPEGHETEALLFDEVFGLDAVTLTSPLRPVAPCAPLPPFGPAGSWPLLKSVASKEPSRTCAPLTAFGEIFRAVTAFRLSCSVPTLLRGKTAFQAASPAGVAPPTATTSAIHHRLGLILRVLAPFGWRASAVTCSSSARPHSAQRSRSVRAGGDARSV